MKVTHSLTEEDVARAHKLPTEPKQMAEAQQKALSAIDHYIGAFIMPSMQGSLSQNDLEFCLFVLYYRSLAFMKTALVLSNPLNFQSLTGASRSVIEVYIDMELLFQNKIVNGVHLFKTHGDALTLKAARRMTEFYTAHPDLPFDPVSFEVHAKYIENNAAKIDAASVAIWGMNKKKESNVPMHWSGDKMGLRRRARLLGVSFEKLTLDHYDLRNFHIHSGSAGVAWQNRTSMTATCVLAYIAIRECLIGSSKLIGRLLKLYLVVQNFFESMDNLEDLPGFILADIKLQAAGEPARLTFTP